MPDASKPKMERRPVHAQCVCGEKWYSERTLIASTRIVPVPPVWSMSACPICQPEGIELEPGWENRWA